MVGSPRPLLRQDLRQNPILGQLLATSLFEDPAAGLHEHASARLREHRALLSCLILRRSWPLSSVGGHQDLAGGHEEDTVAITQIDRILGPLRCGVSCRPCAAAVRLGGEFSRRYGALRQAGPTSRMLIFDRDRLSGRW